MKKRYKSAYKGYRGRNPWRRNAVPIVAAVILVLGAVAALYFGGALDRLSDLLPHRQPVEDVDPAPDPTPAPDTQPDPAPIPNPQPDPDPVVETG